MPFFPYQAAYIGNGMVIGLNAVIHVIISHGVAIGAFAVLVFGEMRFGALRRDGRAYDGWHKFNTSYLRFIVLVVTIVGAVTGAGIWFTTTALAPRGISHMLRIFFYAWFFEYFLFFGEIVLLLILYFKWDSLLKRRPCLLKGLGILYVVLASISAVTITAILGFMLTPGEWLNAQAFWHGVLNPSFLPQLMSRMSFAFIIGSLISLSAVLYWGHDSFRLQAAKFFGGFLLISTLLFAGSVLLYFYVIPTAFASHIRFSVLTSHFSRYPSIWSVGNILFFVFLLSCALAALSKLKITRVLLIPAFLSILLLVIQFERIREFIRGPYLMPGHMYVNGILLEEAPLVQSKGVLAISPWYKSSYPQDRSSQGAFIFGQNCTACHTIGGINDIRDRLRGRSRDGIYVIIGHTHDMTPFMPPFLGTENERQILTDYLYKVLQGNVRFKSLSRSLVETSHE